MNTHRRGRRPFKEITGPQRRTLQEIRIFTIGHGFPRTIKELAMVLPVEQTAGMESQMSRTKP